MELAVILLVAVLLFGADKIPKLARSTGEAMGEFEKGREEVERELQEIQASTTAAGHKGETTSTASETENDSGETDADEGTESGFRFGDEPADPRERQSR
jgi:sec-independent protein translocase protein TatA